MGYGNSGRLGKFYWSQVAEITQLLERYINEQSNPIDTDKYLRICEQLGQEPDPAKMPLQPSEFPHEVQVAFFVYGMLSDVWDGMSGTFLGKNWAAADFLLDTFDIEERKTVVYFTKLYENLTIAAKYRQAQEQRKAEERRQKSSPGGGKQYTHNVRG